MLLLKLTNVITLPRLPFLFHSGDWRHR